MGYRKISLFDTGHPVFLFKRVFSSEKIHGTSAHISFKDNKLRFHSGGVKYDDFIGLFDERELLGKFKELGHPSVTVYGEAYGGRCQNMADTYGHDLRFIVFEVRLTSPRGTEEWLPVPRAEKIAIKLGLEFVPYAEGPCTIQWLTEQRDLDSVQAVRNGCGHGKKREGVVIRPVEEFVDRHGGRIMAKFKNREFSEQKSERSLDPDEHKKRLEAENIAAEFTVLNRLQHVLDHLRANRVFSDNNDEPTYRHIPIIIRAMGDDIRTEEGHNFKWSRAIAKEVGRITVALLEAHILNSP